MLYSSESFLFTFASMKFNSETMILQMNKMGRLGQPFVFLIDFLANYPLIFPAEGADDKIMWQTPYAGNCKITYEKPEIRQWQSFPVSFDSYKQKFNLVRKHILNGDTFLLNLTQPTQIETNLTLKEIFLLSKAPYKIWLKNHFVCFSPEPFIKITDGTIASFPMKGTIDAESENAAEVILSDSKELAEHHTIVDLIRNDLSLIAKNVKVEKFRYLAKIHTHQKDLWQVSSKITGILPADYTEKIGDIVFTMLPAGSVTGAPKKKTVEIIQNAEQYERGFYTGIFGYFNGKNLDSCVLIRFIEKQKDRLVYKSGGGITFLSRPENEYEEMLKKIYVPVD